MNELGPFVRPSALPFWDVRWSGAVAYAAGTAYASMTDSAAAIRAGIAQAITLGVPVVGRGRFRVDSLVTIACDADFGGSYWLCSDTALAPMVRIGTLTSGTAVSNISVTAPRIEQAAKTGTGWTGTSVGIELANLIASDVVIPRVDDFVIGVLCTAYGAMGTAYNRITIIDLAGNKVQLKLKPNDTSGYVNQNEFFLGRSSYDAGEGTAVAGTRQVLIEAQVGQPPNNNRFYGSIEGNVPEYHIESIAGQYNRFFMRFEATTPKVYWNELSATWKSIGNRVSGFNAEGITFTNSTNSTGNGLDTEYLHVMDGGDATGLLRLRNGNSTADPAIVLFDASTNPLTAGDNDWLVALAASITKVKAKADANPRWQMASTTGLQSWGNGTDAVDAAFGRLAADILGTSAGDKLVANAGLGVGNSAAGSTPGTCVKKMQVFDASGASLGYVAIYDAIT